MTKTFEAAAGLMAVLNGTPQQAPDGYRVVNESMRIGGNVYSFHTILHMRLTSLGFSNDLVHH